MEDSYFPCPLCYKTCPVPTMGIITLPDHKVLANLIDTVKAPSSTHQCTVCAGRGRKDLAVYYCVKCEDFKCDDCSRNHKKARPTRDHLMVRISSVTSDKAEPSSSKIVSRFGRHGHDLCNPFAICGNKADDVVVSNDSNDLAIFVSGGKCKKHLDQTPYAGPLKNHSSNRAVTFTLEGYIAVAMRRRIEGDSHTCVAVVQSLAGREVGVCLVKISDSTRSIPTGIAVMARNQLVVSDAGLHCVYIFDNNYRFLRKFGKKGTKNNRFQSPNHVAVNLRDDILVSDYGNHCVKIFDERGNFKIKIGSMGTWEGELLHPMGLCVDPMGNTLVADRDNHRIQVYDHHGYFMQSVVKDTFEKGRDIRPEDVTFNNSDQLLVLVKGIEGLDFAEIRVYDYDIAGERKCHGSSRRRRHSSQSPNPSPHKSLSDDTFPSFDSFPSSITPTGKRILAPIAEYHKKAYVRPLNFEANNNKVGRTPSAPILDMSGPDYDPAYVAKTSKSTDKHQETLKTSSKICVVM